MDPDLHDAETTNTLKTLFDIVVEISDGSNRLRRGARQTRAHRPHASASYGPFLGDKSTLFVPQAAFNELGYDGDFRLDDDQRDVIAVDDSFEIGNFTVHIRGANDVDTRDRSV